MWPSRRRGEEVTGRLPAPLLDDGGEFLRTTQPISRHDQPSADQAGDCEHPRWDDPPDCYHLVLWMRIRWFVVMRRMRRVVSYRWTIISLRPLVSINCAPFLVSNYSIIDHCSHPLFHHYGATIVPFTECFWVVRSWYCWLEKDLMEMCKRKGAS